MFSGAGQKLYYDSHYKRLQSLKDQYDPYNLFNFPSLLKNKHASGTKNVSADFGHRTLCYLLLQLYLRAFVKFNLVYHSFIIFF